MLLVPLGGVCGKGGKKEGLCPIHGVFVSGVVVRVITTSNTKGKD